MIPKMCMLFSSYLKKSWNCFYRGNLWYTVTLGSAQTSKRLIISGLKLSNLLLNGVKIWTIKDNYRLDDDIQAKILAFAFGMSAEIERGLIS